MKKYSLIAILLLICSCYGVKEGFDKYIFIPDKEDPNLPAYTELGYNTFGADYDDSYFLSSGSSSYGTYYHNGILDLYLNGRQESKDNTVSVDLIFSFPSSPVHTYQDLAALNGTTVDLTGDSCRLIMEKGYQPADTLTVSNGHLNFKRVQILRIDREDDRAILSGTFDAQFLRNNASETISNGRFDLGITGINKMNE